MKTKSTIALSFATFAILFTAGCRKEEKNRISDVPESGLKNELQHINSQYPFTLSSHAPSAVKTVMADIGGGWTAGEAGSIFGPWGAFAGALIGGVASSLVYIYALPAPPLGPNPGGVYAVNSNNPFDAVGVGHNQLCAEILSENQSLYVSNGNVNEQALFNRLCVLAVAYYNRINGFVDKGVAKTVADIPMTFAQFQQTIAASVKPLICDGSVQMVMSSYESGLPGAEASKAQFLNYTLAYENATAKSTLPAQDKAGLFCYFAIARNSYMFWN